MLLKISKTNILGYNIKIDVAMAIIYSQYFMLQPMMKPLKCVNKRVYLYIICRRIHEQYSNMKLLNNRNIMVKKMELRLREKELKDTEFNTINALNIKMKIEKLKCFENNKN